MKRTALALATVATLASCTGGTQQARPASSATPTPTPTPTVTASTYTVDVRPADYRPDVTNPWFPLTPGTTLEYRGSTEDGAARELLQVSDETALVDGVRCRVVLDRLYVDGELAETTRDFYAQDLRGNVWYFGEDTAELESDGTMVGTAGTWHAGVGGALPGIVMPAQPAVGDTHRQEYLAGQAEDFFRIEALSVAVKTPYRSFTGALRTSEWTPLEPGVLDAKYYVRGIGEVSEASVRGGHERLSLVRITHQ